MQENIFYVYEHIRKTDGQIFYVGKGCGKRKQSKSGRSEWWRRIADKHGFDSRIVIDGICEELAHFIEMELIAHHRQIKTPICNITLGGEGVRLPFQSPASNAKRSAALSGRVFTDDHRAKISEGVKRCERGDSWRANIKKAAQAQSSERRKRVLSVGSPASRQEIKDKISKTLTGRKMDASFCQKRSEYMKKCNPMDSAESRAKVADKARSRVRPKGTCPHCGKTMLVSHLKRWHFDNCKALR